MANTLSDFFTDEEFVTNFRAMIGDEEYKVNVEALISSVTDHNDIYLKLSYNNKDYYINKLTGIVEEG